MFVHGAFQFTLSGVFAEVAQVVGNLRFTAECVRWRHMLSWNGFDLCHVTVEHSCLHKHLFIFLLFRLLALTVLAT